MRTNAVLAERLCEAKYSELYPPEGALIKDGLRPSVSAPFLRQRIYTLIRERYDGAFLGALRPCSLASSIEDSTSRPSELRKRTLVLVLGQVVLTEPCGSVSVIRWIIATLRVLLVASLPEMRTAHARMSIDGICVQVRGNV